MPTLNKVISSAAFEAADRPEVGPLSLLTYQPTQGSMWVSTGKLPHIDILQGGIFFSWVEVGGGRINHNKMIELTFQHINAEAMQHWLHLIFT